MNPKPYEIYRAKHQWGNCNDARPWLVVDQRSNGIYGCFPIASRCYQGNCFYVDSNHADFGRTGLSKSCYIHDESIVELPLVEFQQFKGQLEGTLLAEFKKYAGL